MLSAEAYSFHQKSRLAISLSWIAGYTNVVALIVTGHVVSHVTGNVTFAGEYLMAQRWSLAWYSAFLVLSFFAGSVASAVMTESARRVGRPSKYVLPIAVEAACLVVFAYMIRVHADQSERVLFWMAQLMSFAMGLQNATITRISGAVVRTTHLTGVVTDLGLEGVQLLLWYRDKLRAWRASRAGRVLRVSQRHPTVLRVALLASIFGSFVFGLGVGVVVYNRWHDFVMVPPVLFLLFLVLRDWWRPISDVRELDLLSDPELKAAGIVKSLLPPELGLYRLTFSDPAHAHEPPNFEHWVQRLPRRWRVIILAVSPLTRFTENSAHDLLAAIRILHQQRRRLVIAHLTAAQYKVLEAHGVVDRIEPENLIPDLELAIARGMELLRQSTPAAA